jgi:hypothetical protein
VNRTVPFVIAVALLSVPSRANLLTNGSFETPGVSGQLGVGSTTLTGWTVINNGLFSIHSPDFGIIAPDGSYCLDLTGYNEAPAAQAPWWGGVEQTIGTVPFAVYTIRFDLGSQPGTSSIRVSAGSLSALASATSSSGFTWTTYSSTFTASGSSTTIDLIGNVSAGDTLGLDNVVVELEETGEDTPEPASALLACAAFAGIWLFRRRPQAGKPAAN